MARFTFCPDRNVPETLPRDAPQNMMTLNGWSFASRPTTPYQRRFKFTLYGLRWRFNATTGLYDAATDYNFNARALELFYQEHETWKPFTLPHQHIGDLEVRFASPLTVPKGIVNGGGLIETVEVNFIEHNPGY